MSPFINIQHNYCIISMNAGLNNVFGKEFDDTDPIRYIKGLYRMEDTLTYQCKYITI